jgi:hypothetical protein
VLVGLAALLVISSCARQQRAQRAPVLPADGASPAAGVLMRERFSGSGLPPEGRDGVGYLGRSRIVSDNDQLRTIIDLDARTYTVADKRGRVYWTMGLEEMFRRLAALDAARQRAWEEQRRQRPDLGSYDGIPFTFAATGRTDQIAGHPAREYRAEGGRKEGSAWVADDIPAPREARRFEELAAASGELDMAKTPLSPAIPGVEGLVLRGAVVVGSETRRFEHTREVLEVREAAPPGDLLDVPAGFRRVPPPPEPKF